MGLMAVLSAAYLIKFRHALALPRALLVVPVAMACRSWPTSCASPS
jgi:hypothetical protein